MVKMLTTFEIARCLQLCPNTVRKMAKDGRIPSMRIGRKLRFDRDAVCDALCASGNVRRGGADHEGACKEAS